jgi:polysaccharide deacetylase family protein (PEP-CTERM system associated)
MSQISSASANAPVHILSVDVEDYFQVEAFAGFVPPSTWEQWPSRVERNTQRLLELFGHYNVKATFFILGWVADRFPKLVREVHAQGHEVACHSYWHQCIYKLSPEQFRKDTQAAMESIEQAAGVRVRGYRAPSWSITKESWWALQILADLGFAYDSSIFPIQHDLYGVPGAPRLPYKHSLSAGATLREYPPTTVRIAGMTMPAAGGGYLRILPMRYTEWVFNKAEAAGEKVVVYLHPWEVDPEQPRIKAGFKSRFRHYSNMHLMEARLERLLRTRKFMPFRDWMAVEPVADAVSERAPSLPKSSRATMALDVPSIEVTLRGRESR